MFIVNSTLLAVAFCFVTMLCWGSWGNTQKLAARTWRYELFYWDYVIGMVLFALVIALTMGSVGTAGRPFLRDIAQVSAAGWGWIILGGVIFNASNILLSASTSIAGMSVAFPLGVGISMALGTVNTYIVERGQGLDSTDPAFLGAGVVLVVLAIVCNGIASGSANGGSVSARDRKKGILLAIVAGVLMSLFYSFVARAMDLENFASPAPGKATPYTAIVIFSIGVLLSNFVFNTIVMKRPFVGEPVSYREYFSGSGRTHLVGMLGGAIWCLGTAFSYIASGKAGASVSYALGQGAPMIAAIWGVFIWKEFKGAPKRVYGLLALMFCLFISGLGCIIAASNDKESAPATVDIIMETDLGNDVDDALAMDMLYKYLDAGKINLLAVNINKEGSAPGEYADILNTWYGYPDIPIGVIRGGAFCETDAVNYAMAVDTLRDAAGAPAFARSVKDYDGLPDAHILYRKILASRPDNSVVIASVGFSTNLIRLLETEADEYSPLNGYDLVARKVRLLVTMAGCFNDPSLHEYNVVKDIPAAKTIFERWPSPVVTSPFEVGAGICYPATSIENDFAWTELHPVVEAYKAYQPMPYDRPTWDLTAVLYAVEGGKWFTVSPRGRITVTDEGSTIFTPDENGDRQYLSVTPEQAEAIKTCFVNMIPSKPAARQ